MKKFIMNLVNKKIKRINSEEKFYIKASKLFSVEKEPCDYDILLDYNYFQNKIKIKV